VQSELRNIERISENTGADYHQMQHFITESNWETRKVITQVATEVSTILPKRRLTGLIIDESDQVKKGNKSVGVGGNVEKISNSQVAVFACLSNYNFASMVDARLYLPKDRCDDPHRCQEAGIIKENRGFKTKLELAVYIIHQQVSNGISFDFIGADKLFNRQLKYQQDLNYLFSIT